MNSFPIVEVEMCSMETCSLPKLWLQTLRTKQGLSSRPHPRRVGGPGEHVQELELPLAKIETAIPLHQ